MLIIFAFFFHIFWCDYIPDYTLLALRHLKKKTHKKVEFVIFKNAFEQNLIECVPPGMLLNIYNWSQIELTLLSMKNIVRSFYLRSFIVA